MKNYLSKAIKTTLAITTLTTATFAFAAESFYEKQQRTLFVDQTIEDEKEVACMALNIYYETRAVSLADAMAVSDVVYNRVESRYYPNTVCDVVHDGYKPGRRDCQFSWFCDGKSDTPNDSEAWERSRKFAHDFYYYGAYKGLTEGSTHYHANYVSPYWAPTLDRVTRIGAHIFYRRK